MHAPLHTSGRETTLTGVWSQNPERASSLASVFGVRAFRSLDELLDASEAVDFAVPPAAQASLAIEAAQAGKALLLEKPLAASLEEATRLVEAIDAAGVVSMVILTKRYQQRTRDFVTRVESLPGPVLAITGRYVHGGFLESGFVDPAERAGWRSTLGALYDLGPHLLDLADAVAGPIRRITASGDPAEVVTMSTEHEGGAVGQLLVSGRVATPQVLTDLDVFANKGHLSYSTLGLELSEAMDTVRSEFAAAVRTGAPVTVDAHRALAVQRVIEAAAQSLKTGRAVDIVP
jgi:predicted dehydrogenase